MKTFSVVALLWSVVAVAQPLEPRPVSGEDAEYTALLDAATRALEAGQLDRAYTLGTAPFRLDDRFALAQRDALKARAGLLLSAVSEAHARRGELEPAAVAAEAAGALLGTLDLSNAERLVAWAQHLRDTQRRAEALWVVRRALTLRPDFERALLLDAEWSRNRFRHVGLIMMGAGVAGVIAGIVGFVMSGTLTTELTSSRHPREQVDALLAQRSTAAAVGGVGLGAGVALFYGGLFTLMAGQPEAPVSPATLPSLTLEAR